MIEQQLQERLRSGPISLGEIVVRPAEPAGYVIRHWQDDQPTRKVTIKTEATAARDIVKYDEHRNYRPLKGAPNLRTGWELRLESAAEVRQAIDYFYPGAFATWLAYNRGEVTPVDLGQTLARQTGMYRVTQKLTGSQAEDLAGRFCQSRSGCLRTILWTIDRKLPQKYLPTAKFDPLADQLAEHVDRPATPAPDDGGAGAPPYRIPFLCVEACNLFVAEARKILKVYSK